MSACQSAKRVRFKLLLGACVAIVSQLSFALAQDLKGELKKIDDALVAYESHARHASLFKDKRYLVVKAVLQAAMHLDRVENACKGLLSESESAQIAPNTESLRSLCIETPKAHLRYLNEARSQLRDYDIVADNVNQQKNELVARRNVVTQMLGLVGSGGAADKTKKTEEVYPWTSPSAQKKSTSTLTPKQ